MSEVFYRDDDIAIIGMAGRFPEADNLDEFWANLIHGRESVRPFPESRVQELARMVGFTPAIRFARFGYLNHSMLFEPEIFALSQEESKLMDPQQRLLLELVEEAILDAGYNPENLFNHQVGVFVADNDNKYTSLAQSSSPMIFVNSISASNAGRVSYTYNFHGPALVIGTACSSSMVALHYACQSLKLNEAELAVAGGVSINLFPTPEDQVTGYAIFSPDQKVRTFDKDANGTIMGEGGGVVLLKRLQKAIEDGDNIHAIIKGSAINNDGKWSNGITAPSEKGQEEVIAHAVRTAGIDPLTISYIEAHGTGTPIGDPIEIAGLSTILRKFGVAKQAVPVGALKTNIGHLDSAAGIAGVIKTVLALKHQQIPPSVNFSEPNPLIDFVNSPVYVNRELASWEAKGGVRRAGVTSLSLVGTNAHVILEEAAAVEKTAAGLLTTRQLANHPNLVTLSARTEKSLMGIIQKLAVHLDTHPGLALDEVAYTLNSGRRNLTHKFVTSVKSIDELRQRFARYLYDLENVETDQTNRQGTLTGESAIKANIAEDDGFGLIIVNDDATTARTSAGQAAPVGIAGQQHQAGGAFGLNGLSGLGDVNGVSDVSGPNQTTAPSLSNHPFSNEEGRVYPTPSTPIWAAGPKGYHLFKAPLKHNSIFTFIVPDLADAEFTGPGNFGNDEPVYQHFSKEISACMSAEDLADKRVQYLVHVSAMAHLLQKHGIRPKAYVGFGLGELIVSSIRGDVSIENAVAGVKQYNKGKVDIPDERFDKGIGNILKMGINAFFLVTAGPTLKDRFIRRLAEEEAVLFNLDETSASFQDALIEMMQKGFVPDWEQVYGGRGLRKLSLPGYVFDRKSYILFTDQFQRQLAPNGPAQPVKAGQTVENSQPAYVGPGTGVQQPTYPGSGAGLQQPTYPDQGAGVQQPSYPGQGAGISQPQGIHSHLSSVGAPRTVQATAGESASAIQANLADMLRAVYVGEEFSLTDCIRNVDLDSVQVMQFATLVKKEYGIEVPLKFFFEEISVNQILQQVEALMMPNPAGDSTVSNRVLDLIPRQPEREYYPVSSAQKRQFILNQIEPDSLAYNLPGVLTVRGNLTVPQLEATFKELIRRHEVFRTSFTIVDGQTVQIIHPEVEFRVAHIECSEAELAGVIKGFVQPFDLAKPPLLRVGLIQCQNQQYLIYDMHHIISDGTSSWIFFSDFIQTYTGRTLPEQRIQYRDFAVWQNEFLQTERYQAMEKYWLERFFGEIPVLNLPTDYPRPAVMDYRGAEYKINLTRELLQEINRFATEKGVTLYMFLLAVYNVLLAKYANQEDIVVGSPISGRTHADLQNLIGIFVNTLAMRNQPQRDKTFDHFLQEIKTNALQAFENQEYQFETLVNKLDLERDLCRNPLFDTMFVLQNTSRPTAAAGETGVGFAPFNMEKHVSQFDLSLMGREMGGELSLTWEYSTGLFKPETIQRMANHLVKIIREVLANPARQLGELELITAAEKDEIINVFNRTQAYYPKEKTMLNLFVEQVAKTPDAPAVLCGNEELSYRQLHERSNQLARRLQQCGVGCDQLVGVVMERSSELMVGLLAIWKAGGAYLPMNPHDPADRLEFMLSESDVQVVLTQTGFKAGIPCSGTILDLTEASLYQGDASSLPVGPKPNDLAYMIYTSGSTGKPKGVMIEHHSIVNRLYWMQKRYPLSAADTILQKTPYTFDVSVWELFWWMMVGAKVAFLVPGGEKEPEEIVNAIERYRATTMHFVPSMLTAFLEHCQSGVNPARLWTLKQVFASGEALSPHQVENFNCYLRRPNGTRLINLYGPTEATVDVSYYDCPGDEEIDVVPIGRPIDNIELYIIDSEQRLLPVGIAGELCIAGVGLARGYRKRPELTAEKFVPNPFRPGERMYRTGDLARWMPDGNIEFLGRIDHQVKIRGFRIELGEIENLLMRHPAIRSAVVIDREAGGSKYLCAYIVFQEEKSVGELREFLARELPEYMLPAYFVSLPEIPLNASGKVDRKALPAPDGSVKTSAEYVAPQNEVEMRLAAILSGLMALDKVGIDDKFFEIGGDSIKIIAFSKMINQEFDAQLKVQDLFKFNTIRKLADHISHANTPQPVKEGRKFKY